MEKDSQRFWILLTKKLSGEASLEELAELEILQKDEDTFLSKVNAIEKIWAHKQNETEDHSDALERKWNRFENKLKLAENKINNAEPAFDKGTDQHFPKLIFAIPVLLTLIALFLFLPNKSKVQEKTLQIAAPQRGISKILLPDGSRVWLNSGSTLSYKNSFGEKDRAVVLVGEAFFDVVKDQRHPFTVSTSSMKLKVLGTVFNIKAYEGDKTTEAALIHGKIQISLPKAGKEIILKPSEKLTVKNDYGSNHEKAEKISLKDKRAVETPLIALSYINQSPKDSLPTEALWLENKLAFDEESLEDVAKRMERWYGVTILINNEKLKNSKFTGKFTDESLASALKALQTTSYFNFRIKDKTVVIN